MQSPGAVQTVFGSLELADWRQFEQIEIKFHPRVTTLTGANGSGKTTVLNLLSRHFGWAMQFVELALLDSIADRWTDEPFGNRRRLHPDFVEELDRMLREIYPLPTGQRQKPIGRITYENGAEAVIAVHEGAVAGPPASVSNVAVYGQLPIAGLNMPAHRSVGGYQAVQQIPASFNTSEQILNTFTNELRNRYLGVYSGQQGRTPLYWLKEALIAAAIYGEGNSSVVPNPEAQDVFEGFQKVLRKLLPPSIGFNKLYIRSPEVVVSTATGDFALDAVSGGVSAIMELAWQIFLRARNTERFVVCIDEPENHLHPELQRTLLPQLVAAFPNVQFVVSTHSPFIVGSVPDSAVYVLRFDQSGKVHSEQLDMENKAGSASEVLLDVLGMQTTLPAWAEAKLDAIVEKYTRQPVSREALEAMRIELGDAGLASMTPKAISEVFQRTKRPDEKAE